MESPLQPGSLQKLKQSGSVEDALPLKVVDLQEANGKFKCEFSDGKENMSAIITSQVSVGNIIFPFNPPFQFKPSPRGIVIHSWRSITHSKRPQ